MRTFTETSPLLPSSQIGVAVVPSSSHTSILITIGALAGVIGSAIGTTATIGLVMLPFLRERFPTQMKNTQLDEYAEELFSLIAFMNPLIQELSQQHQQKIKAELKNPEYAKDLILSYPDEVVRKLTDQPTGSTSVSGLGNVRT